MAALQNITDAGVDQRMRRSVMGFAVILAALVAMASLGTPTWAVAILFLPLLGVANLAYQGLFKA